METHNLAITSSISMQLAIAVRAAIVFLLLCGILFTASATYLGKALFPKQAEGSLIQENGVTIGSRLIAQPFNNSIYFYGRPSAANYDPTATAGSNLAPSNPKLREEAKIRSARIQQEEQVSALSIPVDLISSSGSGLDPDISPQAAYLQAKRIASARKLPLKTINTLIKRHTQGPQWGIFGESRVNVLLLNIALDNLSESSSRLP